MHTQDFPEEVSAEPDWCVCVCWDLWKMEQRRCFVSIPISHLLFLNEASCVRVRGEGDSGPIPWIYMYSGFVGGVFRSVLHNKTILILAISLKSKQARHLQNLEHLIGDSQQL